MGVDKTHQLQHKPIQSHRVNKSSRMQKVAMILSSMVDLRVRGGIVPAHAGRLDKVASWVNKDRINIRTAPSTDAQRITLVDRWTKVQVLGRQGDWSRIRLQSGAIGWVLTKYLSPTKPPQTRQVATRSSRIPLPAADKGS